MNVLLKIASGLFLLETSSWQFCTSRKHWIGTTEDAKSLNANKMEQEQQHNAGLLDGLLDTCHPFYYSYEISVVHCLHPSNASLFLFKQTIE